MNAYRVIVPCPLFGCRSEKLLVREQWSSRQISGALALQGKKISHESIYRLIRYDESGLLATNCRHKMKYRRHRHKPAAFRSRSIPNRISIHDRPPEANGKRFGGLGNGSYYRKK